MLQPGNGPEDALFVTPLKYAVSEGGEEKIWIHSFPNYIGLLNLTQSLKQKRVIFDQKFSGVGKTDNPIFAANQFIPYEDSVFLVCPDINRSGPTLSNCNPSIRFYSYKTNSYTDPLYLTDYDLSAQKARTLMSHTLALKPDKQQIAVVFTYLNQLIIVDLATSCKTVVTTDPQLPTSEADTFKRYYLWVYATDHSIFAYRIEPNQVIVEVFDWNGNGVYKLHLPHPIINTTLAPAEKAIYGINASDYSVSRFDLSTLFPDKI